MLLRVYDDLMTPDRANNNTYAYRQTVDSSVIQVDDVAPVLYLAWEHEIADDVVEDVCDAFE